MTQNMGDMDSPYKTPESQSLDKSPETYRPRVHSFEGRIGRARFIAYSMWMSLLFGFLGGIGFALIGSQLNHMGSGLMTGYAMMIGVLFYIPFLGMAKRRLNDLDTTGWLGVLIFVPFINILFILVLVLWPGKSYVNNFGPPAQANSLSVIIFGVVLPVMLLILLVLTLLLPIGAGGVMWIQGMLEAASSSQP